MASTDNTNRSVCASDATDFPANSAGTKTSSQRRGCAGFPAAADSSPDAAGQLACQDCVQHETHVLSDNSHVSSRRCGF